MEAVWTVAAKHLPAETTNVRQAANNVTQTHTYKPWEMGRMKLYKPREREKTDRASWELVTNKGRAANRQAI